MVMVSVLLFSAVSLVVGPKSTEGQPKFKIASTWSGPDKYGQCIDGFGVYGNSSGSWVLLYSYTVEDNPVTINNWSASVAMKIGISFRFNSTLTGASSATDGKRFQRQNVSVVDSLGATVFTKQNFTYDSCDTVSFAPIWLYAYWAILNFLPAWGGYYTVTVTYDVFW